MRATMLMAFFVFVMIVLSVIIIVSSVKLVNEFEMEDLDYLFHMWLVLLIMVNTIVITTDNLQRLEGLSLIVGLLLGIAGAVFIVSSIEQAKRKAWLFKGLGTLCFDILFIFAIIR